MSIRESKIFLIGIPWNESYADCYVMRCDIAFIDEDGELHRLNVSAPLPRKESPDDIRRIRESARKALKQEFRRCKGKTLLFLPPVPDIPTTYIDWRTGKVKP